MSQAKDIPATVPTTSGNYDLSKFDLHYFLAAQPEEVFRSWATSGGLESFFVGNATYESSSRVRGPQEVAQKGDKYHWTFLTGTPIEGEVLEICEPTRLSLTFDAPTKIILNFSAVEGGTEIHLCQSDMPLTYDDLVHNHLNCRSGWTHFLVMLKARLERNIDLREHNPQRAHSLSTMYHASLQRESGKGEGTL